MKRPAASTIPWTDSVRGRFGALLALSAVAIAVRLYAARTVGFGDSESLYASYALFPQPAYLDHPGMIGLVARALGHGGAPSPAAAHAVTSVLATLAPWAVLLACRILRADLRASLGAALVVAVTPEVSVGLFAMTPDLVLFFAMLATIALFARGLLARAGSAEAAALFVGAGVALGIACSAKVSGLTLAIAIVLVLALPSARPHAKTVWPWTALVLAALVFAPVIAFEARSGWPMLRHRLVETQHDAGVSLRNAVGVLLGQAVYVSPILCLSGVAVALDLFRARRRSVVCSFFAATVGVPLAALGALCLWSKVAEPHWLAPVWLPLLLYFAYRSSDAERPSRGLLGRRALAGGVLLAFGASAVVYAWVLNPSLTRLVPSAAYDARLDLANELYGWPEAALDVERAVESARVPLGEPSDVVVAGPVWMVCAQLRAALPREIPVGCAGSNVADFATWTPLAAWSRADVVILVYDNRAPARHETLFPDRVLIDRNTRVIRRGDRVARVFTIERLSRRAAG